MRVAPSLVLAIALVLSPLPAAAAQGTAPPQLEAIVDKITRGDLSTAERELRRLLAQAESPRARSLLGRLLLRQGRLEAALVELRIVAARVPLERDLALWLAGEELGLGNEAAAEVQLVSVLERYPSVRALLQLARLQGRRGQTEVAAETVHRALALAPHSEEVLAAKARVSLAVDRPVPAIQALEALTRMHPTVAEHSYLLGVASLQIGDLAGAIEALERSLEFEPDRALALVALGSTLSSQKRFEEAKSALLRGLRLDPGNVEALAALAEAEEGLGELENAEEHATLALSRKSDHARALATIGLIRMSQQKYQEARDVLLRAVQSEPDMSKAHYQLSLAFARLGDRDSSSKHLELYRESRRQQDERLVELRTRAGRAPSGGEP